MLSYLPKALKFCTVRIVQSSGNCEFLEKLLLKKIEQKAHMQRIAYDRSHCYFHVLLKGKGRLIMARKELWHIEENLAHLLACCILSRFSCLTVPSLSSSHVRSPRLLEKTAQLYYYFKLIFFCLHPSPCRNHKCSESIHQGLETRMLKNTACCFEAMMILVQ